MKSRLAYVLALSPTLLLLACGGKVIEVTGDAGTGDPDSATDGSTDARADVIPGDDVTPTEVGPGGCGFGACEPGMGCSDGCNSCTCVARDRWECTTLGCVDAEPPPPPPPCPSYVPSDGSYCPGEGAYCTYPNGCGGNIYASCAMNRWYTKKDPCAAGCPSLAPAPGTACTGPAKCNYVNSCGGSVFAHCDATMSKWAVETGPCVAPACPEKQPIEGSGCVGPNKCSYSNGCGGYNSAYCESPMSKWVIYRGDCPPPPPPPPVCPATMPPSGSTCSVGSSCTWNNGCGGLAYGYCSGGGWSIKNEGCSGTCPSTKPPSGVACKAPSATACRYVVSPSTGCTSQCYCADDYRWACVTPPCTGMGGGEVPPSDPFPG